MKYHPVARAVKSVLGTLGQWAGKVIRLTNGDFWREWNGGHNFSGKSVTQTSVLQLSTAWACIRLVSQTMATLPVHTYKKKGDGTRVLATGHGVYELLHSQPNITTTAATFWQVFFTSILLRGVAYVEKKLNGLGDIVALYNLMPDNVGKRATGEGTWVWTYNDPGTGQIRDLTDAQMWMTIGFSVDGVNPISPISMGANIFGGAQAADEASADTFKRGMKATGLVTVDNFMKPAQREDVRQHVQKVSDAGGYFVLEKGSGFQQLNMNPQDAQLLQTRIFNVEEICRWFGIDPSLVSHGGKDSNWGTGLEQKMMWFVTLALRPLAVKVEQSIRLNLFPNAVERMKMSSEFSLEGLLRGDSASRAAFYSAMVQNGIYTRDDCRDKENLPRMGGNAAVLTVQSNLLPLDKLGEGADPAAEAADALKAWLNFADRSATEKQPALTH